VYWIHLAQDWEQRWGCCEHDNELLGPIRCREFVDYLSNCQLLKGTLLHGISLLKMKYTQLKKSQP
jgi:hypothetical protein